MYFDFELILFYAIVITGVLALIDIIFFAPKRKKEAEARQEPVKVPMLFDYSRSFFPILLIVFVLRSFLMEPFRIPSSSLEPTLLTGDFILVNKFDYGFRLPVLHKKIMKYGEPKRGDIMIFRWPPNPAYNFIKRVIGLPGDRISYVNKELYVNGEKIPQSMIDKEMLNMETGYYMPAVKKEENLLGVRHQIYVIPNKNARDYHDITVPQGMYFVMGDNRDDSADSRYWGFVPEENIVGKAVLVWMSWNNEKYNVRWGRIGSWVN